MRIDVDGVKQRLLAGNLESVLSRYSDILLAVLVVIIVGLMIVPVPTWLLDILLATNLTIGITILMISLYVPNALALASFPTILLVGTLFRLALNVSSTRLILLNANAGEIIRSFGKFVVQGDYVVGFVIFLIITIIQFVVIAKGAERVSEVAARFTLDALPGKQMSIDGELRAGIIDAEEAKRQRSIISRESQFHGAMDGAMKFVKGDAIAGILISIINILAGLGIGVVSRGLPVAEAAKKYTLLTVGDGLVSQIPSLIIAFAAGIITTRVAASSEDDEGSLGHQIGVQLLAQPKAILMSAGLLMALGLVPGLPFVPFAVLSVFSGSVAYGVTRTRKNKDLEAIRAEVMGPRGLAEGEERARLPMSVPVMVETGSEVTRLLDVQAEGSRFIDELVPQMREWLFEDLGVAFPGVRVRAKHERLEPTAYTVSINEVPVANGHVYEGRIFVGGDISKLELMGLDGVLAPHPSGAGQGMWVEHVGALEKSDEAGDSMPPDEYIAVHLTYALRRNIDGLIGIQEVQNILDAMENRGFEALVRSVVPSLMTVPRMTDVLRRLLREDISIRNMRAILEALAEWATYENDLVHLTEYVRRGLKNYIAHRFASANGELEVYLLDPRIEQAIRDGIQQSAAGSSLSLEPEISQTLLEAFKTTFGNSGGLRAVLLTQMDVRYFVHSFLGYRYPNVVVLSFQELPADRQIQPLGRVAYPEKVLRSSS